MKQTLYSRILLILSGILLGIAAVLTYTAAIRVFPFYTFISGGETVDPASLLAPLTVPILALTSVVLMLGHLYGLFSRRSILIILLGAVLVPIGRYYSAELDPYSGRYLFPCLTFWLYPQAFVSILCDAATEHPGVHIVRKLQIGCECISGFILLALTVFSMSEHVLLLSIMLLVLAPFLPLWIGTHTVCSMFGRRYPKRIYFLFTLISSLIPLSCAIRPFHFDLSLILVRIGIPTVFVLLIVFLALPPIATRFRNRICSYLPLNHHDKE